MSEIVQIIEESPTIVQVFSDLTINTSGGAQGESFTQAVNASEWIWNHNRGVRQKPTVYNLAWQEVQAEIFQPSENQIRVRVNPAQQGYILI